MYQQARQYFITKEKNLTCLRTRFKQDLTRQLKKWRQDGDQLLVALDANEDIYQKTMGSLLMEQAGLDVREVMGKFTRFHLGPTYFCGSKPIDSV